MPSPKIRVPRQKRSIEKKNKIIQTGYDLFSKKGYHNTNTAEIAKAAGVSTGVLYDYFEDKKDIFMNCLEIFCDSMALPAYDIINAIEDFSDLEQVLSVILNIMVTKHKNVPAAHQEIEAMALSDPDVGAYLCTAERKIAKELVSILVNNGIEIEHMTEKAEVALSVMENLCHMLVFGCYDHVNAEVMKDQTIRMLAYMIREL